MHHDAAVEAFYTTRAWRRCRASVLSDRGGLCEVCYSKGLIEPATQVHHKKPITPENVNDPMITLDSANLLVLCDRCHQDQHHTKRWRCEPNGHVEI